MKKQVEKVINDYVRPYLNAHNGDLDIVNIRDGLVEIKLRGACSGCPSSDLTVKDLIERALSEHIQDFKGVILSKEVSPELMDMARKILNIE